jgi:hypothetical protein
MLAEWEPHEACQVESPIHPGLIEIPRLVRCGREAGYLPLSSYFDPTIEQR